MYSYSSHRLYLGDYYAFAKANEYGFSLRVFARRAGIRSWNYLRLVIDGKRNLTPAMAARFAKGCGLVGNAAEFFCELVAYSQASTSAAHKSAFERLYRFRQFRAVHRLAKEQSEYHSNWYVPVIRELVRRPDFDSDPKWVAQTVRPPITRQQAARALALLSKLGLVTWGSRVLNVAQAAGFDLSLVELRDYPEIERVLRLERPGHRVDVPVPSDATSLLPSTRVVAVPSLSTELCDIFNDACLSQEPHVLMVSLEDEPEVSDEPLPLRPKDLLQDASDAFIDWGFEGDAAVEVDEGVWVFGAKIEQRCNTDKQCAALGVPTESDGDDESSKNRASDLESYRYYVLDLTEGAPGSWHLVGAVPVKGARVKATDVTVWERVAFVQRQVFLESDEQPRPSRLYVDTFAMGADGTPTGMTSINVPGFVVGALGPETIVTVAPRRATDGGATLARVAIQDDAALAEAEQDLPGAHRGFVAFGTRGFYLAGAFEVCGGPVTLSSYDLEGKLKRLDKIELSEEWSDWRLHGATEDAVWLRHGYRDQTFARFRVGPDGSLEFAGAELSHCSDEGRAELDGQLVRCAALGYGSQVIDF